MILLRGGEVYDPEPRGRRDVLVGGGQVLDIFEADSFVGDADVIDASGALVLPGFVDALTHPCGGGGEGGFANRTPELDADCFLKAGVTTPVGALGTDSLGRSLDVLYGCVMGLRAAGLNALMYTGAYRVPPPTLTGDVARDIYLVDPVIGVGELAVADHRGTQPTEVELRRVAAETQLGGILAGAGGTVLVHVGDGPGRLKSLRSAVEDSDLPPAVLYPTHVNRSRELLDEAAEWARLGGYVDITVSTTPELIEAGDIPAPQALEHLIAAGAPAERITFSSDAGGSLPVYRDGELQGLTAAAPDCLLELVMDLYGKDNALFAAALAGTTRNPAAALKLGSGAGCVVPGHRADLLVVDSESGQLRDVICAGQRIPIS